MTVVPLRSIDGGFDFDGLFESLKGQSLSQVLVITDDIEWYGNVDAGEALLLMDRLRHKLVKGEEE